MKYSKKFASAVAAFVLIFSSPRPATAIVIRDDVSDTSYQNAASSFTTVGRVPFGSATLIAPDWVLTAAHLASAVTPGTTTFDLPGVGSFVINQVVTAPGYVAGQEG